MYSSNNNLHLIYSTAITFISSHILLGSHNSRMTIWIQIILILPLYVSTGLIPRSFFQFGFTSCFIVTNAFLLCTSPWWVFDKDVLRFAWLLFYNLNGMGLTNVICVLNLSFWFLTLNMKTQWKWKLFFKFIYYLYICLLKTFWTSCFQIYLVSY